MFGTREFFHIPENVKIFSYLVRGLQQHFRVYCILRKKKKCLKNIPTSHENLTFMWEGNISHNEKIKIPLLSPKATRRWSLSATIGRHPQSATRLPPTATSIKDIFENLSNIFGNLIYTPNTPKISYLRKLLSKIEFLKILLLKIKIYSVYQTVKVL